MKNQALHSEILSYLIKASKSEQRSFVAALKNSMSERDQQALYNRQLSIKNSHHVLSDEFVSNEVQSSFRSEMPGSFNLSLTKSKMSFKCSVTYSVPDAVNTWYWIGIFKKDDGGGWYNYLAYDWVRKTNDTLEFGWLNTEEFTQDDNSVLYEARLIKNTDQSVVQRSTNMITCQSGVSFKDDENSRVASRSFEDVRRIDESLPLSQEANKLIGKLSSLPSIDIIENCESVWNALSLECQNNIHDLLFVQESKRKPIGEVPKLPVENNMPKKNAANINPTLTLKVNNANCYFDVGLTYSLKSFQEGDFIQLFYSEMDEGNPDPKTYSIKDMKEDIKTVSGSKIFSAGKYGLKEEKKEILVTLGAYYWHSKKHYSIVGASSSVPFIKIGTMPQISPRIPNYYNRKNFCKKDAVLSAQLSKIAYDFTNLEEKLKWASLFGRVLDLELQFERDAYDTQGFIATNVEKDTIYIAFRGSEGNKYFPPSIDWYYNYMVLAFKQVDIEYTDHKAIYGMAVRYNDVKDTVYDKIKSLLSKYTSITKIIVTGHSLGAALANLLSAFLTRVYPNTTIVQYTFGTPPIINKELNNFINGKLNSAEEFFDCFNFYDLNDPVAKGISEHAGYLGFWWYPIRIPFRGPDPSNPHSISTNYVPYIKNLPHNGTCNW